MRPSKYASGSQVPNAERYLLNKKIYVMSNFYSVVLTKTSCNKGEYEEVKYDFSHETYEDALSRYEEVVISESKHISGLTFIKSDATIVVLDPLGSIRRRVRIAN